MTLIKVTERLDQPATAQATLSLPFELRQKSRFKANLDSGEEVGLMLPRGHALRGGDCLRAENGMVIALVAAQEPVTTATAPNPLTLQRACYHLGNRHVPLQITEQWIRYLQDHVLDDMVASLGLTVTHEQAPFEPETGAYHHHHHD
ncbi:MAG: urease accessory protein UreE [Gammaproteobacteria bacterium]|jgi:urease accessory protein